MQFRNQGLTLWLSTADAPSPGEIVAPGTPVRIRIGVAPADASNRVQVSYRVGSGPLRTAAATWVGNDSLRNAQYFEADLGFFERGERVEYIPICVCAGRRVPASVEGADVVFKFLVGERVEL